MLVPRLWLVKMSIQSYLGLHEEATQLASQLISAYTEPAGPIAGDINSLSAVKLDEYVHMRVKGPASLLPYPRESL